MWYNNIKAIFFLTLLSGIFLFIGSYLAGTTGLTIAFIIALIMNGVSYFYSDKIILNLYRAQELDPERYNYIYNIVKKLANADNLPMPKLYIVDTADANAFATGRDPKHSSIAVTQGIINLLDKKELAGVLAHELSHVKNRDTLISSIAAVLATAIGYIANMARFSFLFNNNNNRRKNPIGQLLIILLMPIAAMIIQFTISRSREYLADYDGAKLSQDPEALASALEKLHDNKQYAHFNPRNEAIVTTSHMLIVNPFSLKGLAALFSSHPPVWERIARLNEMKINN